MTGASYRAALRGKGTAQLSGPRAQWPHKGDAAVKFEGLSSDCQIANERLMKCVQPAQEPKQRSCLSRAYFQVIVRVAPAALQSITNQNI